jgi:hypothetical protein
MVAAVAVLEVAGLTAGQIDYLEFARGRRWQLHSPAPQTLPVRSPLNVSVAWQ